jgi:hypothetical protein
MDADHPLRAMPTICCGNKASSSSGTPESVVALDWNQWTASPELVDDFIGIRNPISAIFPSPQIPNSKFGSE